MKQEGGRFSGVLVKVGQDPRYLRSDLPMLDRQAHGQTEQPSSSSEQAGRGRGSSTREASWLLPPARPRPSARASGRAPRDLQAFPPQLSRRFATD